VQFILSEPDAFLCDYSQDNYPILQKILFLGIIFANKRINEDIFYIGTCPAKLLVQQIMAGLPVFVVTVALRERIIL